MRILDCGGGLGFASSVTGIDIKDDDVSIANTCEKCGGEMVCRCGQTESSHGWPCGHGSCLFECPKCLQKEWEANNALNRENGY